MEIKHLLNIIPQIGKVEWIGLRTEKKGLLLEVEEVEVNTKEGLVGDHYNSRSGNRQVTLIQSEHLDVMASILKKQHIDPQLTRRNIVVSGINLNALKNQQFRIGENVILETTGHCHPCTRMEKNMGAGGYNAMRGHGGITCKVIQNGTINLGDQVRLVLQE